jgi:hypothetical protein
MKLRQFFTEANDRLSMMRLLSSICIVSGCIGFFVYPDYEVGYLGLVTLGFGGKATQKTMEVKNETKIP